MATNEPIIIINDDPTYNIYKMAERLYLGLDLDNLKYPAVDNDGDVWLGECVMLYIPQHDTEITQWRRVATKEQTKLYWRYHRAWKLMNR